LKNSPLETRSNPTAWRDLLRRALPALDHVFGADAPDFQAPQWTLGGGTAIALRIEHRLSDDVDIFILSRPLRQFTPARNPAAKAISASFQWPGHYLKFECEGGEIDFLSAQLQTEPGFTIETFEGRPVALETLDEVIAKKVRYRAARFAARDVFDLAAVGRRHPKIVETLAAEVADALPRLEAVVEARRANDPDMSGAVRATLEFADLVSSAYAEALDIIRKARSVAT
jgi:hypothetical protein